MNFIKPLLISFLTTLPSCVLFSNDPAHATFHGSSNFTNDERWQIELAIDMMYNQTDGAIDIKVEWDNDNSDDENTLDIMDEPASWISEKRINEFAECDKYPFRSKIFFIRNHIHNAEKYSDRLFREIAIHELIHSFGIKHLSSGIMSTSPSLPYWDCIDEATMSELQRHVDIDNPLPCHPPSDNIDNINDKVDVFVEHSK
jgi:hypothetical protein